MANTLESVMRLTDQYTATMQKIMNSADAYEKKQKEADSAAKTFQKSVKDLGSNSSGAASGITSLALKIGGIVSAAKLAKSAVDLLFNAVKTGSLMQVQENTMKSLMGNAKLGTDLYNYINAYSQNSALGHTDLANAATSFLAYTKNINQINQLLNLVQRLYMFNPEQGAEGAVFALKEVLSGQTMSLKNRFNMTGISADTITKNFQKGDITGTIKYLDQEFNKFGATQGVVDANFNTLTVQSQRLGTNIATAMGTQASPAVQNLTSTLITLNNQLAAGNYQGFLNSIANGANAVAQAGAWLAQNYQTVIPIVSGVISAFVLFHIAASATQLIVTTLSLQVSAATQNWIAFGIAVVGALSAGAIASKMLNTNMSNADAAKQLQSASAEAAKLAADQKALGASTKGNSAQYGTTSVPTKVTNSSPIKVSGTVEIEKENLKYVFEASAAKFFASFSAQKIEPSVNIQNQNVSKEADVNDLDYAMGNLLAGRASASAGGNYK